MSINMLSRNQDLEIAKKIYTDRELSKMDVCLPRAEKVDNQVIKRRPTEKKQREAGKSDPKMDFQPPIFRMLQRCTFLGGVSGGSSQNSTKISSSSSGVSSMTVAR